MATNAIAGYKGKVLVSASTSAAVAALAEVRNWELALDHTPIDATSHDSSGDRELIAGIGHWTGTAEFLQVMGNSGHQSLFDVTAARTKVLFEFYATGSSSDGYYNGEGFLGGFNLGSPNEDGLQTNVSFEGSGAVVRNSSST